MHVERGLELALAQESIGTFATLALVAAGFPLPDESTPAQLWIYQLCRAEIQAAGCRLEPDAAERILRRLEARERGRQ